MKQGEVWGLTMTQIRALANAAGLTVTEVIAFEFGLNRLYVMRPQSLNQG